MILEVLSWIIPSVGCFLVGWRLAKFEEAANRLFLHLHDTSIRPIFRPIPIKREKPEQKKKAKTGHARSEASKLATSIKKKEWWAKKRALEAEAPKALQVNEN